MTTTDRAHDYPRPRARIHLNLFQPFGPVYEWSRTSRPEDYYEFEQYARLVTTAERGLFSAVFLGESLRLREHLGALNDIAITGRPDALTLFSYLAARTTSIGFVATLNTTYSEPAELARRLATVDLLTGGRAGWNIVTTHNAWTGENFRRGGFLGAADRYRRAEEYVAAVQEIWEAFPADGSHAPARVERHGDFVDVNAWPTVPRSPQGQTVYFQAGDSDEGRDFAARRAEGVFTHHIEHDDAVAFTADLRRRARAYGRPGDDIKVFPGAGVVVAATEAEARDKERHFRDVFLTDRRIRQVVESVWGRDLSDELDVDGALPVEPPSVVEQTVANGVVNSSDAPRRKAEEWRALAIERGLTVRGLVEHLTGTRQFVGTPGAVADQLAHLVRSDAFDGLNVTPSSFPDGLDDVVDLLVPALQERGVYPDAYAGSTLRENLGLPESVGLRVPEGAVPEVAQVEGAA
jgi:FMN-dependent oxidoreductase (nitrilotriacetate monooxygenase family)